MDPCRFRRQVAIKEHAEGACDTKKYRRKDAISPKVAAWHAKQHGTLRSRTNEVHQNDCARPGAAEPAALPYEAGGSPLLTVRRLAS